MGQSTIPSHIYGSIKISYGPHLKKNLRNVRYSILLEDRMRNNGQVRTKGDGLDKRYIKRGSYQIIMTRSCVFGVELALGVKMIIVVTGMMTRS